MDSNYNLAGLINRAKARLKDASYSESDITQFLNDSYFEILGEAHYNFLERYYLASSQLGGPLLLPPDFQAVEHLVAELDHNRTPLRYLPSNEFFDAERNSSFTNYRYTIFGNQLFYSLPDLEGRVDEDGDMEFYKLHLYYLAKPVMLVNDTDVPLIPAEFGEALLLGALARAEQIRDNYDYATIYENKKDELVTNMKLRYCPRQLEGGNRAQLPVQLRARH